MTIELDFSSLDLCGRSREIEKLEECFLTSSKVHLVVVEGDAGSGKAALVNHFLDRRFEPNKTAVYLGKARFEKESAPADAFSALKECLDKVCRQMIGEQGESCLVRHLAQSEVDVLAPLIPCLGDLVRLSGNDLQPAQCARNINTLASATWLEFNRLRLAIRSLVRIARRKRVLVLSLNDIHWADKGSLLILETLFGDVQGRSLLIVATCTQSPLPADHPVAEWRRRLDDLCDDWRQVTRISLLDLTPDDVVDILSQLLRLEFSAVQPLAETIHKRTGGNARCVLQFIRLLRTRELLSYSLAQNRWTWDLEQVFANTQALENVGSLLSAEIGALPCSLQSTLMCAASLALPHFDLQLLIHIFSTPFVAGGPPDSNLAEARHAAFHSPELLEVLLDQAVDAGFLDKLPSSGSYKFVHGYIAQSFADLASTNEEEKAELHTMIGMRLLSHLKIYKEDEKYTLDRGKLKILSAMHLNRGFPVSSLVVDAAGHAALNEEAADAAFKEGCFFDAVDYLQFGLNRLEPNARWSDHYSIALMLSEKLSFAFYCTGHHNHSLSVACEALSHARFADDKLNVAGTMMLVYLDQNNSKAAIRLGRAMLRESRICIPTSFRKCYLLMGILKLCKRMKSLSDEELLHPGPSDCGASMDKVSNLVSIFVKVCIVAGDTEELALVMVTSINSMLDFGGPGNNRALLLAQLALMHAAARKFEDARRFAKLSMAISNGANPDGRAIILSNVAALHSQIPYQDCLENLLVAARSVLKSGDISWLSNSAFAYCIIYFLSGMDLRTLETETMQSLELATEYGQGFFCCMFRPLTQFVLNLRGLSDDPLVLRGQAMSDADFVMVSRNSRALECVKVFRMILAFLFGDLKLAEKMAKSLNRKLDHGRQLPWWILRVFYDGLLAVALFRSTGRSYHRHRARRIQRRFEALVREGNVNAHHMMMLLKAELVSLSEPDINSVQRAYDNAVVSAARLGFLHHAALSNELAGKFFLNNADKLWASSYLGRAHKTYEQWGASAKAKQMKQCYESVLKQTSETSSEDSNSSSMGFFPSSSSIKSRARLVNVEEHLDRSAHSRTDVVSMQLHRR